jgi:hypothetical protein
MGLDGAGPDPAFERRNQAPASAASRKTKRGQRYRPGGDEPGGDEPGEEEDLGDGDPGELGNAEFGNADMSGD